MVDEVVSLIWGPSIEDLTPEYKASDQYKTRLRWADEPTDAELEAAIKRAGAIWEVV
ncbi:MAG: hypothetical protein MUO26_09790 [Methanotrichaceae archaeon]|nr:hypothetical protein [Methanotrichaceae archaeon]